MHADPPGTVARQTTLRARNLALVAGQVFASADPLARVDVANATGMTRSTASRLVDQLVAGHVLRELTPVTTNRRGRPAVPLAPSRHRFFALGVEINVAHLTVLLMDLTGEVLAQRGADGDHVGAPPAHVAGLLVPMLDECLAALPTDGVLVGVQVAVPGLVDQGRRTVLRAPNLGWRDVAFEELLDVERVPALAGVSSGLANEADCAALLAARDAPGRRARLGTFLHLSGEVGIGSAIVRDGRLRLGPHGWAGEIGHMCIDPAGPRCACGADGCLERYAGSRALVEGAGVTSLDALEAALRDDEPRATRTIDTAGRALGVAVANAANLLDITTIVLGGVLGRFADHFTPRIVAELDRRLLVRPYVQPTVESCARDRQAAAAGAAVMVLERVVEDPAAWMSSS